MTGGSPGSCADGVVSGKGGCPYGDVRTLSGSSGSWGKEDQGDQHQITQPEAEAYRAARLGVGGDANGTQGHVRTGCDSVWCVDMVMANGPRINVCLGL